MKRGWEVWMNPEYAESRIKVWGNPSDPPEKWEKYKYGRIKVIPKMVVGDSVLDVGCGLGHTYVLLENRVKEYLGVDLPPMIAICHRFFPENNFKAGDVYDLSPFGLYDTVICTQLLVHLPHLIEPLKQLWAHARHCLVISVVVPSKEERFTQREDGLIGHRWTKKQLASAIEGLEGVHEVETWKGRRIIYIRISKKKGGESVTVDPELFSPEKMSLATRRPPGHGELGHG